MFSVNLGYEFILYKHGPYSFDLTDELIRLRADRLLTLIPKGGYGPSIVPADDSPYLQKLFQECREKIEEHRVALAFVADKLADKKVMELERLATALYVTKEEPGKSVIERTQRICALKPHISKTEARIAVEMVDDMIESKLEKQVEHQLQ